MSQQSSNAAAAGWIISSIVSSTAIITLNKYISRTYNFDFMTSLTAFHFLVTFFLLELMCRMGFFARADAYPLRSRWVIAFFGVGSVVFMNYNLAKNSVGFYQLSKLCNIPAIVLYNFLVNSKKTPPNILISLTILLTGVYLYSVNDIELNILGSVLAIIAVTLTAAFQLTGQTDQAKHTISGPQLQHSSAFPQFVLCFVSALGSEVVNPRHTILDHAFTGPEMLLILLTAIISVSVNVSCFGIIGKTSALTYQVVGHVKTMLILLIGIVVFPPKAPVPRPQMIKTALGMVISMVGIVMYSAFGMINAGCGARPKEPAALKGESGAGNGNTELGLSVQAESQGVKENGQGTV
jgi:solute carrier family 35 protein E3